MILISHRGNINGEIKNRENSVSYILEALNFGYDVEIDVWEIENDWYLGHDNPEYKIDYDFIYNYSKKLWIHCKNKEALFKMNNLFNNLNIYWLKFFWHENDKYTMTSNNCIWTYAGEDISESSICLLPERFDYDEEKLYNCFGICSDFIEKYNKNK